ncbi:hypothetical protein D3C72_809890 [compost metagenome]
MSAGFDLAGVAHDLSDRAKRYAPIYAQGGPALSECIRMLHRNPAIAPVIREAIASELAKLPGGGVGLDQPLFDAKGQPFKREAV